MVELRAHTRKRALTTKVFVAAFVMVGGLGLFVWLGARVGRNDHLQREARFLSSRLRIWQQQVQTNPNPILPDYTVNNRGGTVVRINERITVGETEQVAELGWTNSCLGPGTLIVTSNTTFLWREPNGRTRKLNIPDLSRIPAWWYLTTP